MAKPQFQEIQKANTPITWVMAMFAPALMLGVLIYQVSTGQAVGTNPASNTTLLIMVVAFGLPAFLIVTRLKLTTIIDSEKISYGFNFPTAELNTIKLNDIAECYLVKHKFVGYGYRITRRYGLVYNLSGNKGIQIVKRNSEKVLIGTRKWDELRNLFESRQPGQVN